jgi:hypothetical protein
MHSASYVGGEQRKKKDEKKVGKENTKSLPANLPLGSGIG